MTNIAHTMGKILSGEMLIFVQIAAVVLYICISTMIIVRWSSGTNEKLSRRFKRNWMRFIILGTLFGWAVIPIQIVLWVIELIILAIPVVIGGIISAVIYLIRQ